MAGRQSALVIQRSTGVRFRFSQKCRFTCKRKGTLKQMLIFMNRMNSLRWSSGNHNLRRDVQKTESNFVAWIFRQIGCTEPELFEMFKTKSECNGGINILWSWRIPSDQWLHTSIGGNFKTMPELMPLKKAPQGSRNRLRMKNSLGKSRPVYGSGSQCAIYNVY